MATFKDLTHLAVAHNKGGRWLQLSSTVYIRAGETDGGTKGIYKSTDRGQTWTLKHTFSSSNWEVRLLFLDSQGRIFVGTISTTAPGKIIRSTDSGETWAEVATSEASGWWYMCEQPTTGYLYASEYSIGNRDASELYAYNIWRSTSDGATWSKWYSAPAQSAPGAANSLRHIHHVSCDSAGQLYTGFGDVPTFASPAGKAYLLNDNGTLGAEIDNTANGFTAFAETSDGRRLFGGDAAPICIYRHTPGGSTEVVLNLSTEFGSTFSTAILDMVRGKYGVIYALTNGSSSLPSNLIASGDNGASWALLKYTNDLVGASHLNLNRSVDEPRLFIGRSQGSAGVKAFSIPDLTPAEVLGKRVVIR